MTDELTQLREDNARLRNILADVLNAFEEELREDAPELGASIRNALNTKIGATK